MSGNHKLIKAINGTISDYSAKSPMQLNAELRDPKHVAKMKKFGVDDAQIHRVILILQEHKPNSKELEAYLNSSLV